MGQIKIYIKLIKDIISGEEYLSNKEKFTLLLHFCAIVHLIDSAYFYGFNNILLVLYNLCSFLLYEMLVPLAKNKQFKMITAIASCEVLLFVIFNTIAYGSHLNFNLYCFLMIPAAFFITTVSKEFKRPFLVSCLITVLATADYIFSITYQGYDITELEANPVLTQIVNIFNIVFVLFIIALISFMFTMEMRNSTEELISRNQQLARLSTRDPLTKLANRRSMSEQLNMAMHNLKRDKTAFSVILGDIDDFKKINDTYGHDGGDKVLIMVADTISAQMRDGDFVCRWGGEEILILVKGNIDAAKSMAERILSKITDTAVVHEGKEIRVSMTFGVSEAKDNLRIEDFIQQADNRLYYGKGHGKCQVVSEIPQGY